VSDASRIRRGACPRCRAPIADEANFCGACGTAIDRSAERWRRFAPLLRLWIALLGVNLALGLAVRALGDDARTNLRLDVAGQAISVAIVALAALRERDALRPLFQSHGFHRATALPVAAAAAMVVLFVQSWFVACELLRFRMLRFLDDYRDGGWPTWSAFVLIAVVPPITEEVAFRGVILEGLKRFMRPIDALLLQAAMFSVLHLSPIIFVSHFAFGLGLGYVRERTQRLLPCIVLHAAWNSWVLVEELLRG